jgi:hypothetical protein
MRPQAACAEVVVVSTRVSQVTPESPGIPRAMVLRLISRSPRRPAFLPPSSLRSLLLKNLTPASGRQDHTTSPSASSAARLASPKRPPHPAPTFVTTRTPLLSERDAREDAGDLGVRSMTSGCGRLARRANDGLVYFRFQAITDIAGLVAGSTRSRPTKAEDGRLMAAIRSASQGPDGAYAAAIVSHRAWA